ncbi:hypothetical protein SBA3_1810010 [Candidatus Sulfopaludibacter sp. SbA3]|nr:hypothetical protein SBA3_1810010 [Candidatus Sulfopaludibacter sp. SbA3]
MIHARSSLENSLTLGVLYHQAVRSPVAKAT